MNTKSECRSSIHVLYYFMACSILLLYLDDGMHAFEKIIGLFMETISAKEKGNKRKGCQNIAQKLVRCPDHRPKIKHSVTIQLCNIWIMDKFGIKIPLYFKLWLKTRPGIAIGQKLADSEIICLWTYEKVPQIIRLDPKLNCILWLDFDSAWVTELWYSPQKWTLSRHPDSPKFAVFDI